VASGPGIAKGELFSLSSSSSSELTGIRRGLMLDDGGSEYKVDKVKLSNK
jgi:hypothetical protein